MDQPVDLGRTDRISWPPKKRYNGLHISPYTIPLPAIYSFFKYYTIPCNMKGEAGLTLLLLLLHLCSSFFFCVCF
jgi:hypothetical protein